MLVSPMRWLREIRPAGWCWVDPDRRDWLESLGLRTASDFLSLPGVVVSGHVGRNVSCVHLDGTIAYLKREHRVRLRDGLRSWQDGFGWVSVSAREAAVLGRLQDHGLPGPKCLAYGAADGAGFLLLEAAEATTELRALPAIGREFAERLGRAIAGLHLAGVDQPDLFAKHVLVCPQTLAVTILDWQRAVLRRRVSWTRRVRGLAALRATLPPDADAAWAIVLGAYMEKAGPVPKQFPDSVEVVASRLRRRRLIAAQRLRTPTSVTQELVRIDGERVCAVPAIAGSLNEELSIASLYDRADDGHLIHLPGGRRGLLQSRKYRLPFDRWWAALRGRVWRSPELRVARLLFHLERHGIAAPKLLAYGQTVPRVTPARAFLLRESIPSSPARPEHAGSVRELLHRVHYAGCRLDRLCPSGEPFGIADGRAVISDPSRIRLVKRLAVGQIRRDLERVNAFFRGLSNE